MRPASATKSRRLRARPTLKKTLPPPCTQPRQLNTSPKHAAMTTATLSGAYVAQLGIGAMYAPPGHAGDAAPAQDAHRATGLAFAENGELLFSTHASGALGIYNGRTGLKQGELYFKDSGAGLVTPTHQEHSVLVAGTAAAATPEARDRIAYHSVHENKVIRYFGNGHTDVVASISMCPSNDWFLSASRDGTFRLWDLRSPNCEAVGDTGVRNGNVIAAFDSAGSVFGVAIGQNRSLSLFDGRKVSSSSSTLREKWGVEGMGGAAFKTVDNMIDYTVRPVPLSHLPGFMPPPPFPSSVTWTSLEFSADDRFIALGTADRGVALVDAFNAGREYALLAAHPCDPALPCNATFSGDGRMLLTGGVDGHVYAYDLSGRPGGGDVLGQETQEELPALPYQPRHWEPPFYIVGEGHKSPAACATARTAAVGYLPSVYRALADQNNQRAAMGLPPALPDAVPRVPAPGAAGPEEQVSRHEGPVGFVRWHPTLGVAASASAAVAVWTPPAAGSAGAAM